MKKYIFAVSITILLLSVLLTACSKKNEITDDYGRTHVIATDKDGNILQDPWGNLYEEVTDSDGNTVTQAYDYPVISTNKKKSVVENAVLKMTVPDDWEVSDSESVFRLRHLGKCVDSGIASCQLEVGFESKYTLENTVAQYINSIKKLDKTGELFTEPEQFDAEISGTSAKGVTYSSVDTESVVYCYFIEKGQNIIKIEANVYDGCYNRESIEALLDESCTLKELPTLKTTASETSGN
ncbi:MAG: hypothetical protein PUB20_02255 [Clostridia bacterium]|nr:hypothetical protein [Clostridia bacterium]